MVGCMINLCPRETNKGFWLSNVPTKSLAKLLPIKRVKKLRNSQQFFLNLEAHLFVLVCEQLQADDLAGQAAICLEFKNDGPTLRRYHK